MASPFSIFRKNQKVLMAAATLLSIVAFVFLTGPMMNSFSGSGTRSDEIIARTSKFGNITARQRDVMRQNRMVFVEFLQQLAAGLRQASTNPAANPAAAAEKVLAVIGGPTVTDKDVVDTWLFAREAEAMGIAVDDKTVSSFLDMVTSQSVDRQGILGILKGIRQGVSEAGFTAILREELLALRYRQVFQQIHPGDLFGWVGGTATPAERWTAYKRMREQATIELAVFPAQDFTKQVADPSLDTLKDFFEKYKQDYASPASPNPGFHVPRKVNLQYLQADESQIKVSEEEITQRYEKKPEIYASEKKRFETQEKEERADQDRLDAAAKAAAEKKAETDKKPDTESTPDAGKKTDAEKKPEAEKKAEPEQKPDAAKTSPVVSKSDTAAKPALDAKPNSAGPKDVAPAKTAPAPVAPAPTVPAPKPSGSSSNAQRSPFRLAALAQEKADDKSAPAKDSSKPAAAQPAAPAAAKAADEKKSVDAKLVGDKANQAAPAANPADKKTADVMKAGADKKAGDENKPADDMKAKSGKQTTEGEKPDTKAAGSETAKKESESKTPPRPKIKTAEERLRDEIRRDIAQERVRANLAEVQTILAKFRKEWVDYDAANDPSGAKKPTPPDFGALAIKYSMIAGRTGLLSQSDLAATDLGKSGNIQLRAQVYMFAFGPTGPTSLYKPESSTNFESSFIFWKTDDQPDHVPKWDDPGIQSEVLRVWKLNEARTLAAKRADALKAEAAANAGKPLNELPSVKTENIEVLHALPFSFLNGMFGQLQLGKVSGVEMTGPDFKQKDFNLEKIGLPFMEKVFGLTPNQVDVATNQPKTEIYVVRPIKFTPFDELWSDFIAEGDDWTLYTHATPAEGVDPLMGLRQMCVTQQSEVMQAWVQNVQTDAGLKWEKTAEQDAASGQGSAPPPTGNDED